MEKQVGDLVSTPLRGFFVAESSLSLRILERRCFNPLAGFFCC